MTRAEKLAYNRGYASGRKRQPPPDESLDLHSPEKLLLRQTYEKLQVIFLVVKNLGVEVSQLRAEQKALRSMVLALLTDPQAQHELEAMARSIRIETYKK